MLGLIGLTAAFVVVTGCVPDAPPPEPPVTTIHINEVESNGDPSGDWVELINIGATAVDLSGWTVLDNDGTHIPSVIPVGTSVAPGGYYIVTEGALGFGLGAADSVNLSDSSGAPYEASSWTAHAATTWGRCPSGTGGFTTTTSSTKAAANDCSSPVRINEVESNGDPSGDWIELINPSANPIDLSGWTVLDNDGTHIPSTIPAGTTIAPAGYYIVTEAALGFGLGGGDSANVHDSAGALVDAYSWTAHASTTYGRCPNGTGAFTTTTTSTKDAVNACPGDVVTSPWPGDEAIHTADPSLVLGGNMSGLVYEGSASATPGTLWAVKNGPGMLYRLVSDGTTWAPDTAGDWGAGKVLKYADGTGNVDAEGVTFIGGDPAGGVFVVHGTEQRRQHREQERRPAVRCVGGRHHPERHAEWDLTADLPVVGPNLGLEAITWVPDSVPDRRGLRRPDDRGGIRPGRLPRSRHRPVLRRSRGQRVGLRLRPRPVGRHLHPVGHDRQWVRRCDGPLVRSCARESVGGVRRRLPGPVDRAAGERCRCLRPHHGVRPSRVDAEPEQRGLRHRRRVGVRR